MRVRPVVKNMAMREERALGVGTIHREAKAAENISGKPVLSSLSWSQTRFFGFRPRFW